jgi:hypothetical protein
MPTLLPLCLVRRLAALAFVLPFSLFLSPPSQAQNPPLVIGSQNTVTADPPVTRPHEQPCIVQLFSGFQFVDFSIHIYQYAPPAACPGPWEKVVFTADFNVTAGRQFDRTAVINLGNVNIYFGTTPEPRHNLSPSWHVERDETDYSALFESPQSGQVILGNIVNNAFTGIISGSAALEFYPAKHERRQDDPARTPDQVLPLVQSNAQGGINEPAFLFTPTDQLATTFSLPLNVERAYLDVITQSQIGDEFWYTCVPNDVSSELQSCGGTAFREAEVSVDGHPAGVAPVYPWVYTGGVDPFLWEPIPAVQAMNFAPYRVDLTPFAGTLSNGQPHTIALSVFNSNNHFSATATLLIFQDHSSQQVTGAVSENTIGNVPTPSVNESLVTDSSGAISGSVTTFSSRNFKVEGYANTSHGKVNTEVRQTINFKNIQNFTINTAQYVQDISQDTDVESQTITWSGFGSFVSLETFHYPLTMNIGLNFASDGSFDQQTTVSQAFKLDLLSPFFAGFVENQVNSTDTLNFNSSGALAGNTGAKSSQSYNSFNTRGQRYACSLASENNVLTSFTEGCADK